MGAPYTEQGNRVIEMLDSMSDGEMEDTIRGINRSGLPFMAVRWDDIRDVQNSLLTMEGYLARDTSHAEKTAAKFVAEVKEGVEDLELLAEKLKDMLTWADEIDLSASDIPDSIRASLLID